MKPLWSGFVEGLPKEATIELKHETICCGLGEDGNMESEERVCVFQRVEITCSKELSEFAFAAVMALGQHVFWSTALTFAAK